MFDSAVDLGWIITPLFIPVLPDLGEGLAEPTVFTCPASEFLRLFQPIDERDRLFDREQIRVSRSELDTRSFRTWLADLNRPDGKAHA